MAIVIYSCLWWNNYSYIFQYLPEHSECFWYIEKSPDFWGGVVCFYLFFFCVCVRAICSISRKLYFARINKFLFFLLMLSIYPSSPAFLIILFHHHTLFLVKKIVFIIVCLSKCVGFGNEKTRATSCRSGT